MSMLSFCIALTTHLGVGDGWNEVHPCIRYEQDPWTIGAFLNSEDVVSIYASYTWQKNQWFFETGLATGYSGASIVPIIRGAVKIADNTILFISPAYEVNTKQVGFVLGIEYRLTKNR